MIQRHAGNPAGKPGATSSPERPPRGLCSSAPSFSRSVRQGIPLPRPPFGNSKRSRSTTIRSPLRRLISPARPFSATGAKAGRVSTSFRTSSSPPTPARRRIVSPPSIAVTSDAIFPPWPSFRHPPEPPPRRHPRGPRMVIFEGVSVRFLEKTNSGLICADVCVTQNSRPSVVRDHSLGGYDTNSRTIDGRARPRAGL